MTYKAQTLRNTTCCSSRLNRLDFAGVNLADNAPGCTIRQSEDENEEYDEPPASSIVCMDIICCVETAYDEHTTG